MAKKAAKKAPGVVVVKVRKAAAKKAPVVSRKQINWQAGIDAVRKHGMTILVIAQTVLVVALAVAVFAGVNPSDILKSRWFQAGIVFVLAVGAAVWATTKSRTNGQKAAAGFGAGGLAMILVLGILGMLKNWDSTPEAETAKVETPVPNQPEAEQPKVQEQKAEAVVPPRPKLQGRDLDPVDFAIVGTGGDQGKFAAVALFVRVWGQDKKVTDERRAEIQAIEAWYKQYGHTLGVLVVEDRRNALLDLMYLNPGPNGSVVPKDDSEKAKRDLRSWMALVKK